MTGFRSITARKMEDRQMHRAPSWKASAEKKRWKKVVFRMSFPTSATQGRKVHCMNTFFPSWEFGQGQPFCYIEWVFILYLETDRPNVQGVAFWQWDTSFLAHHSPSEVLRGLDILCPFLSTPAHMHGGLICIACKAKKCNTLSPLVLYIVACQTHPALVKWC